MVLLVVDAQDMIVTNELFQYETFVNNMKQLIRLARTKGIEIIYVRHDDGFELTKGIKGFEIFEQFAPMNEEKIFDKHVNSAFKDTGLLEYLHSKNENTIMITGLQTDYCIDATIKCGFEHGFEIVVPAYCNTTVDNEYMTAEQSYKYYNENMWNSRYSRCVSFNQACDLF
ncbi:cysteine hydrolase family protein [Lacrimispora celerecrescens]|uniref:Nicotinamidase-related amidase n=1 Tax=[Clostridium] celerecrescens 18A TaxID=1286362 RepID=A0A2M8ZB74_9FIRM|nr:cysteine hydrolase family protein [Lacrimispora celerecrescens]PJJ30675.1 nicotinamidase-related amidase [[Clostridium] celerecrescens 18A]